MPSHANQKLYVFILVGCSYRSYSDYTNYTTIEALRSGMCAFRDELMQDPKAVECCELGIISFTDDAWQAAKLCPLSDFVPPIFDPAPRGGSALSAAFSILRASIARDVKPKTNSFAGDFRPLVFVFTDSDPCDDWRDGLANLKNLLTRMPRIILIVCGPMITSDFLEAAGQEMTVIVMKEMSPDDFAPLFCWEEQ